MAQQTETVTTPFGHRIAFFANDYIGRSIRKHGLYERTTLRFIVSILARMGSPVVIDAGANIGNHTLAFAVHARAVYAFEPLREIFLLLEQNVARNHLDNVHLVNRALSDHSGSAVLHVNRHGNIGTSSLYHRADRSEEQEIECITGDEALALHGVERVDFIKLDVEGHELNVIRGLERTLRRSRPVLLMEWNDEGLARRINQANLFSGLFEDYDVFVLGNNRDPEYWEGRVLGRLRRGLTRRLLPKRPRLYSFDSRRIYKNILLVPREKLSSIPRPFF